MESKTKKEITYLALGDSYTIGTEIPYPDNYPNQIARHLESKLGLEVDLKIIAQNAWRTDDLKRAIKRSTLYDQYDLVSLLIGVNNQYQGMEVETYIPELKDLFNKAIELVGGDKNKVFVFSIPNYGYTPFGNEKKEQITKELSEYNIAADSVCKAMEIDFYNVTDISLEAEHNPSFVAKDGLHPTKEQYAKWIEPYLSQIELKIIAL
jgi:acyl-CoA thioesterase-1